MPFVKGQSGNPAGRPPKSRALTDLLEKAGSRSVEMPDGKHVSGKRLIARLAWELATTGRAMFPDGKTLEIEPSDWLALVKWIYSHIDGPPRGEVDLTTAGEKINSIVEVRAIDYRAAASALAPGSMGDSAAPGEGEGT